jgi:hypothetical protein
MMPGPAALAKAVLKAGVPVRLIESLTRPIFWMAASSCPLFVLSSEIPAAVMTEMISSCTLFSQSASTIVGGELSVGLPTVK